MSMLEEFIDVAQEKTEGPIAPSLPPIQKDSPDKSDVSAHRHREAFSMASQLEAMSKDEDDLYARHHESFIVAIGSICHTKICILLVCIAALFLPIA